MIIPFGFTTKDITEEDLRNAQKNLLIGKLTDDDIKNIDAVISYMARNVLLHNNKTMKEPTIEEVLKLVSFRRDKSGELRVRDVYCDVEGNVGGDVGGKVFGKILNR